MASVRISIPGRSIILLLVLLFGGAAAVAAITLFPHASITVHPKIETKQLKKEITLSSKNEAPDYVRFILPAKIVEEEVRSSKTFDNAGGAVTEDFSKGTITFTNTQDEEQRLLPKTQMRHVDSGRIFLLDTAVVVPPQGTLTVGVTAKEKGAGGDVPAGKFVVEKFSAPLQATLPTESTSAFSGGQSTDSTITAQAIETAKQSVLDQAKQDALAKLTAKAGGASIRPDLLSIEVTSQNVSASEGSHALHYAADATVKARGFVVDTHDLVSLMTLGLRAATGSDEEFVSYDVSSFSLAIARTDWATGEARVNASLTGTFAKKIGSGELATDNLAGLSKEEVAEHFASSPNIGTVDVSFRPFWVTSVPSRSSQIDIHIEEAK